MSVYIEKSASVYGEQHGARFESCCGGDLCQIILLDHNGEPDGMHQPMQLSWEVAKVLGSIMVEIAEDMEK